MVLKLHGSVHSTCTRRVAVVLREKKIPFEFVQVDVAHAEHKSPAYMEKQPFGQIPYLDDDGFILYESRAICSYLDAKFSVQGPKLVPTDYRKRAIFEQAASVEMANFDEYARNAVAEVVFKPRRGLTSDQAVFDKLIVELGKKLDAYDVILSRQRYAAGDDFTLVDIFHLPYGSLLETAGSKIMYDEKRPNVVRWWKDITSRQSWQVIKDGVIESNA